MTSVMFVLYDVVLWLGSYFTMERIKFYRHSPSSPILSPQTSSSAIGPYLAMQKFPHYRLTLPQYFHIPRLLHGFSAHSMYVLDRSLGTTNASSAWFISSLTITSCRQRDGRIIRRLLFHYAFSGPFVHSTSLEVPSHFTTDGQSASQSVSQSASQYVLVSSALVGLRPDITSCRNVAVWNLRYCFCGAPSLTRVRVSNLQYEHSMGQFAQNLF
jgi:hypothetical protein